MLAIWDFNYFPLLYATLTEQKARRTRATATPKPSASPIPAEIEVPDDENCEDIPQGFGNGWKGHILQMWEVSIFVFVWYQSAYWQEIITFKAVWNSLEMVKNRFLTEEASVVPINGCCIFGICGGFCNSSCCFCKYFYQQNKKGNNNQQSNP